MKKVEKVEFGLENCELIVIDGKHIGNFGVGDLRKHISKHYNSIRHTLICKNFWIMINRNADVKYKVFDMDDEEFGTFERLTSGDICSVRIVYDDGTDDYFCVDWVGEADYKNEAQHTYINKFGDLFIEISETGSIEKTFVGWDIDSERTMDMVWKWNT